MGHTQVTRHKTKFRMLNYCLLPIACCLLLSSCFKEKTIAPPNNQGHGETAVIEMGPDYNDQFFYSLATNSVLSRNSRFVYDLMFDCDANKFNIWLNTAKFMSVMRTGKTDLDSVLLSDTLTGEWHYELGEFNVDSNAIGKWWDTLSGQPTSAGQVYLIQMGIDNDGNPLGFIKMKVNNFYGTSYSVTYSDFISPPKTIAVQKDDSRNYRYLSFAGNGSLADGVEPAKTDWDLCFTRYSVIFYDPYYLPYEVTGALHNPSKVQAYMDSTVNFDSMTITNFNVARLQTRRDAVGYDWKRYELGDYTAKPWYTYFIKSGDDKFYKLRFLDFKKNGVKGYPTFEFYQL